MMTTRLGRYTGGPTAGKSRGVQRALACLGALGVAGCGGATEPTGPSVIRELTAVTFAQDRYVAVGVAFRADGDTRVLDSDTTVVWTSADGRAWQDVSPAVAGQLLDVVHGGDRFVAVGTRIFANLAGPQEADPVVLTSPDGDSWSPLHDIPDLRWRSVAFGNGRYVGTGLNDESGFDEVAISDDGMTWTTVAVANVFSTRVTFGNGVFVLWGEWNGIGVSDDGEEWEIVAVDSVSHVRDVTFLDGRFVGMADFDCCFGEVPGARRHYRLESGDGRTWTVRPQALRSVFFAHTFGLGRFVATAGDEIAISPDAMTWTVATSVSDFVGDVVFGSGGFVAVGRSIFVSANGADWGRLPIAD